MALLWERVKFEAGFTGSLWCSHWGVSQYARQRSPRVPASLFLGVSVPCLCSVLCAVSVLR